MKKTFKDNPGPCSLEGIFQYKSWSKLSCSAFILYTIYLAYLVFWSKYYGRNIAHHSFNLVPFNTIKQFMFSNFNSKVSCNQYWGEYSGFSSHGIPIARSF